MTLKSNILLSIFCFIVFCGCTITRAEGNIKNPPTKSFVKVINKTEIISCQDPNDKNCPIGINISLGSGMAIQLIPNEMIVLTAGHVCDVGPTNKIKKFVQTLEVLDHLSNTHQAWPILISQNNQIGAPDACLLWVPTLNIKKTKISETKPNIGQELYYIGAPAGIYNPPSVMMFKGIYSGHIDASSAMITAPATGGSSGSAVLNFKNEIVGVIWGSNLRFHHASVMTNFKSFKIFLKAGKKKFYLQKKKK